MTVTTALRPYALAKDGGKTVNHFGGPLTIKADARQTDGAFSLIEHLAPVGGGAPTHVHSREDESFYVLEGRLTVTIDDAEVTVGPGSYAFLPRNIAHAWRNDGPEPARFVMLATPGGFEGFFTDVAAYEDAHDGAPPDVAWIVQCLAGYGVEVLP